MAVLNLFTERKKKARSGKPINIKAYCDAPLSKDGQRIFVLYKRGAIIPESKHRKIIILPRMSISRHCLSTFNKAWFFIKKIATNANAETKNKSTSEKLVPFEKSKPPYLM